MLQANGEEESCIDEEKLVAAHFEADISKFPPKFGIFFTNIYSLINLYRNLL